MPPVLRLYEDILANDSAELALPALPHMIFVVHGSIAIADRATARDEGFGGDSATRLKGGPRERRCGAGSLPRTILRIGAAGQRRHRFARKAFGAARDAAARSPASARRQRRLSARRLRLSASASRAGHPLPARRRHPHRYGTATRPLTGRAAPWYESGPEPVFAQAANRPTRFIRVMILPMAYLARSSVEYLSDEDKDKPRTQKYKIYADMPIAALKQ